MHSSFIMIQIPIPLGETQLMTPDIRICQIRVMLERISEETHSIIPKISALTS
jgi:hypothetical protein